MKILVTGCAGMLGSSLVPALAEAGHVVIPTDIDLRGEPAWGDRAPGIGPLDVREEAHVRAAVDKFQPDLVAHLAAETDLEKCDADQDFAYLTNAIGTKHVALACQRHDIPMVYISTAGVFDGVKEGAYTEFDRPNPINTYGASKLAGEHFVQMMVPKHYIIRAGWMVGGGPGKDHKFVAKMLNQIRDGQTTLYAVSDKLGTPTYTRDFARTFLNLIASESYGLYHMACEGEGSRYDVAEHILHVLGLSERVELVDVDSSYFADQFPSNRPRSEIMRNMALDLQGMNLMRPWRDALEEYLLSNFVDLAATAVPA
jgi:dTDP-4-dehydrorhamnose reductase